MRHLAILIAVLSITVCANAGVFIDVIDSDGILAPGETSVIRIITDGSLDPGTFYFGVIDGCPGTIDISNVIPPDPIIQPYISPPEDGIGEMLGLKEPVLVIEYGEVPPPGPPPPPPPWGYLVDNIILHCDGPGDVILALFDGNGMLLDNAVVAQTPEPMTIGLLGLGAMMLRRKR